MSINRDFVCYASCSEFERRRHTDRDLVLGIRDCLNIPGNFFWPATPFWPPVIFLTWLIVDKNIDSEFIYNCHIPIQYARK